MNRKRVNNSFEVILDVAQKKEEWQREEWTTCQTEKPLHYQEVKLGLWTETHEDSLFDECNAFLGGLRGEDWNNLTHILPCRGLYSLWQTQSRLYSFFIRRGRSLLQTHNRLYSFFVNFNNTISMGYQKYTVNICILIFYLILYKNKTRKVQDTELQEY